VVGRIHKLTAMEVKNSVRPGRINDGGGLYLRIKQSGTKSWSFKWKRRNKSNELGIGPYPEISLQEAREQAANWRKDLARGSTPARSKPVSELMTFGKCADLAITSFETSFKNQKHRQQWRNTVTTYCAQFWTKPIGDVVLDDVEAALRQIWTSKTETATRLRGRIEKIISFAITKGWHPGPNPAIWRGNLDTVLPKPNKLSRGHHKAMPYEQVPAFFHELVKVNTIASKALQMAIRTAARSGEIRGALWSEFDLESKVWTIPAERYKTPKPYRIPLSDPAIAIIEDMEAIRCSDLVFPGYRNDHPLSDMTMLKVVKVISQTDATVHGFRSSFRDWAGDQTDAPREVAEGCLGHTVLGEVERAYRRRDDLEKRRVLMNAWNDFLNDFKT